MRMHKEVFCRKMPKSLQVWTNIVTFAQRNNERMEYLKYKGYTGSVEYSEEDKCLYGKVQGMSKDSITYEGTTVGELTADFEGAIDDYLALCEEKGNDVARALGMVL